MKKIHTTVVFLAIFLVSALLLSPRITQENGDSRLILTRTVVDVGGNTFDVMVADTQAKRTRGLSGREILAIDEGLFFIFENPGAPAIWMKDVRFSIDIIWISEDLRVVYIKNDVSPQSFPEIFTPTGEALYVLEVNSGTVTDKKIKIGDSVVMNVGSPS